MVVIWFGQKCRVEPLGVVAELCGVCQKVRKHTLGDYFTAVHVQYINLQRWQFAGSGIKCHHCKCETQCAKEKYTAILPEAKANWPINDLLSKTNQMLAAQLREIAQRELGVVGAGPSVTVSDPELIRLHKSISSMDVCDPDYMIVKEKLKLWGKLDADKRQLVSQAVAAYLRDQERLSETRDFLAEMAHERSKRRGWVIGLLVVILLPVALMVAIAVLVPKAERWMISGAGLGSFLVLGVIWFLFKVGSDGDWIQRTLLPRIKNDKVDPLLVLKVADTYPSLSDEECLRFKGIDMRMLGDAVRVALTIYEDRDRFLLFPTFVFRAFVIEKRISKARKTISAERLTP